MGHLHDYATLPLPLTPVERQELDCLEATIALGLATFYAVGEALVEIRHKKLYRMSYPTFEDYCRGQWNIERASAYRMIDAAIVKERLSPIGDTPLPENEAQIRALKAAPPDKQADIWQKAVETAPNGTVTAKHIAQVIQIAMPREPDPPPAPEPERQISVFIQEQKPAATLKDLEKLVKDWLFLENNCNDLTAIDALIRITQRVMLDNPEFNAIAKFIEQRRSCPRYDIRQACKNVLTMLQTPREPEKSELHTTCVRCGRDFITDTILNLTLCPDCLTTFYPDDDAPAAREPEATIKDELEPEPADTLAPGVWYICDFCGNTTQQAYNTFRNGNIKSSICTDCTQKALHALLDPHAPDVIADTQAIEHALTDPPFGCSAYRDRMKLLEAGLRVFRVDEHTCTLKEFKWGKSSLHEGIDPDRLGSWQKFEQFDTTETQS